MADAKFLKEDDYLNTSIDAVSIVYHPNLNVILVFGESGDVRVIDVNSGAVLHSCPLRVDDLMPHAKYLPEQDKVLFWNNGTLGLRGDYNQVLLLDTILQTPIVQTDDMIRIELILSEAVLFLQSIQSLEQQGLENTSDVINELKLKIGEAQQVVKKGVKAQRWETICLELPHSSLKMVASGVVLQLKRLGRHIPALAIASAINERLTDLIVGGRVDIENANRFHMFSEAARRQTFEQWPHMDYKWALPDQMAQAGFYHQPGDSGVDRAMCFTCNVCLVCWEKTDEPWSEHERHSPDCPFVKGEYTQNVPLAVTYATGPALSITRFTIMSNDVQSNIICTGSRTGDVNVWNVERQLQSVTKFNVSNVEKSLQNVFNTTLIGPIELRLTALATYIKSSRTLSGISSGATKKVCLTNNRSKMLGAKIVAGVSVVQRQGGSSSGAENMDHDGAHGNQLALIVYQMNEAAGNKAQKDHNNTLGVKKSASTLSTIEERFEDDEFMKFLANEADLQQLQLQLENYIDIEKNLFSEETSKNDDQKLVKFKGSLAAWSQTDSISSTLSSDCEKSLIETPTGSSSSVVTVTAVQIVPINTISSAVDYEIDQILPTPDTQHLLVVVKPTLPTATGTISMEIDEEASIHSVQLVLFRLNDAGLIDETPIASQVLAENEAPLEICMLPKSDAKRRLSDASDYESDGGFFVMTCTDGSLKLFSLASLKVVSEAIVDTGKFISVTYCKSLERICGATDKGSLHFYSFFEFDADSSDERDDDCIESVLPSDRSNIIYDAMPSTSAAIPKPSQSSNRDSDLIAYKQTLTLNDLRVLYSLTMFDDMPLPYNAEVPGCWSELIQAQKQRRHPNHLRQGDDTNLTRTWRLHNDATTWDEHLIEINLPKNVTQSIGHIDFKFTLYQPCANPPAIQLTLLKQKSFGLCCRRKTVGDDDSSTGGSSGASGDFRDSYENPVLSEEFLQARNAEILAGPIELASYMDLSEQGGIVTLTSPKLLKSKSRNFLLHIKTVADSSKDGQGKTRVPVKKKGLTSILLTSFANLNNSASPPPSLIGKDRISLYSTKPRTNNFYTGCDWLHEISITVRAAKHIHKVSNERIQRLAMLESNILLDNLTKMVARPDKSLVQNLAFDIINWIISIRMTRYRSPLPIIQRRNNVASDTNVASGAASADINEQQSECIQIIGKNLTQLIRQSMVMSNRSIAHKCSKFILTALEGAQNMTQLDQAQQFELALKTAIVQTLPSIIECEHAGALRWFTLLISGTTTTIESHTEANEIVEESVKLLVTLAQETVKRSDSHTMLLRSRFGLYGLPFEPELFDAELPHLNKISNLVYSYVPSAPKPNGGVSEGNELRVLPFQLRRKGIGNHFKGVLEVEPLHYVCSGTSEATRLENADSAVADSGHLMHDFLLETPGNMDGPQPIVVSKGVEKSDNIDDDMMNNVKNILVDKFFYSAIKKNKLKEDIKEAAKSFDLEVSVLSGYNENENSNDDWGPEPRVVYLTNNQQSNDSQESIMEDASATSASLNNKIQEFFEESNANEDQAFQWHKILSTPPRQTIVVDRMHSGARRFVILDFGQPTMLTDLIIPAYPDLASIAIDIWCFEEEADSVRLVVSQDIGMKSLVLSDLQPPPICRYLKITFTGRYGMTGTRCKIPMGAFFGHVVIAEQEGYADPVMKYIKNKKSNYAVQLKVLNALFEDVHCRYCLSSSKLSEYLQPFVNNETSNMAHMQAFLNKTKETVDDTNNQSYAKILATYDECIYFQYQLNLIKRVIDRIESITNPIPATPKITIQTLCTDKLRVLNECLVEILLHCITTYSTTNNDTLSQMMNKDVCTLLFDTVITSGDTHTQLATCSFLVRVCGFQPWWGDFIASIFNRLFSSKNTQIFPQDRIFFLLTYLGRKSISMGACRILLIDAILKAVAELLIPLSQNYANSGLGIWPQVDLTQLSWLLLFLSVCSDDGNDKKDTSNYRWDFMSGEGDIVKTRMQMCNNNSRTFSRSFKKRYMQSKATSSNHTTANDKYYMMSHAQDFMSLNGNSALQMVDAAKKQQIQQHELMKLKNAYSGKLAFGDYFNEIERKKQAQKIQAESNRAFQSTSAGLADTPTDTESAFEKGLKIIKTGNMVTVIRGLIGLILTMDFTCNMDLFLLTCKIIARLIFACRSQVQFSKLITQQQLLQLIRITVWDNQQQPWAVHAVSCLLQDILDADKNYQKMEMEDEGMGMDVDAGLDEGASGSSATGGASASGSSNVNEFDCSSSDQSSNFIKATSLLNGTLPSYGQTVPTLYADVVKGKLPSLMECEDAEMDELLDNLFERDKIRKLKKDMNAAQTATSRPNLNGLTILYRSVSAAMDSRLEHGLDTAAEIALRRLTMKASLNLFACLPNSLQNASTAIHEPEPWPTALIESWSSPEYNQRMDTNTMLQHAFDNIFFDLNLEETWLDIEKTMQIWLMLNGEVVEQTNGNGFGHNSYKPKIPFGDRALHGLLKTLATSTTIKLRAWCLAFQCLIMACKPPVDPNATDNGLSNAQDKLCHRMGLIITQDVNFENILLRFFSGTDKVVSATENGRYAGPTICKLIVEFFGCIASRCGCKAQLKEILLRVLLHLVQPGGAISLQQGPIDAQSQLIKELLKYSFDKGDLGAAMSIVESISHLVYNNIVNEERIYCKKSADSGNNNNVFGSLFATVLGSENSRHCKTVTDNTVLVSLLKLALILIKTKVPRPGEDLQAPDDMVPEQDNAESQTDEIKAEQQGFESASRPKAPYFADTILQHAPTMHRLLSSLSYCSNSSFAMLVASSLYTSCSNESKNAISEPQTVADAVFQLLIALTKIGTQHQLIVRPLYDFLHLSSNQSYALPKLQLSEPFLWFILKVLESQEAVQTFADIGGIRVLCQSLVRSNQSLVNPQPSLVSMIMQHISKTSGNLQSNLAGTLKKNNVPATRNEEGLINFAPYCTISSDNPTAQPTDVLIQSAVASHRRVRTPAWSYLFYPNESHVDLTITLPAAVLLKEIQLQPHVSTLASCPSAVAVEISRDGNVSTIPISQPISTVGMTCIRLKFNQPEIATSVVVRLYRPKDSTNIGLTQILVLGTTVFGDNSNNNSLVAKPSSSGGNASSEFGEDDSQSKSSLGWLRILAECFNVATFNNNLPENQTIARLVISQAAEVPGFLEACCTLLSVATPSSSYALSNLETVLLKLGLHDRELGLKLINNLLKLSIPQSLKSNNDAVSDLIYILCTTQDDFSRDRIETMLNWVQTMPVSEPGHVKCLASILWQAYATTLIPDLPNMITEQLFDILYRWTQRLASNDTMKRAVDAMMCSVCCIRPEIFTILLRRMGVLVPNLSTDLTASISDDRKEEVEYMTDDVKLQDEATTGEWYSHLSIEDLSKLNLSTAQLETIALACQSPLAIQLLIDSGLPGLFATAILEFCHREMSKELEGAVGSSSVNQGASTSAGGSSCLTDSAKAEVRTKSASKTYPMVNVAKITEILNFFAEICSEGQMRDWLGSYDGSVFFWEPLMHLLCNNKIYGTTTSSGVVITPQPYLKLEEAVIRFMSRVTSCHPKNQETFTTTLIYVIRKAELQTASVSTALSGPSNNGNGNGYKMSISGFTRRLVLQILLESEKVLVSVHSELPLQKKEQTGHVISHHPSKRPNSHHLLFYLSTNTKCHEILEQCGSVYSNLLPLSTSTFESRSTGSESSNSGIDSSKSSKQNEVKNNNGKALFDIGFGVGLGMEFLSVAAGVTAKDKRLKEAKNQAATLRKDLYNVFKMKIDDPKSMSQIVDFGQLMHTACPDFILSNDTTISQILAMLKANNISLSTPCINLTLVQGRRTPPCSDEIMRADDDTPPMKAADFVPLPSPLQIFSSRGGLSLLAHYLPTVYPETPKSQLMASTDKDKGVTGQNSNDWVKVEPNEEIYEDLDDTLTDSSSKVPVVTSVPQHSLAAFGLFLKLPAYSEVLLRDKLKAQCLLRLILGVTGDGEGNEIYSLSLSSTLPTLPFEVFRQLLDSSPLTTDDGVLLRRMVIEVGAIHLVLNCLSIFTHHTAQTYQVPGSHELQPNVKTSLRTDEQLAPSDDKSHMYWAKGTGFGTGSTQQSWNVEQALLRQKSEEEHVTVLLQILSSYINPGDKIPSSLGDGELSYRETNELLPELPPIFLDLMQQSCLIPALSSYLRNDSVLDITRHIPLYRAILQLLRAISLSSQLISLLLMRQNGENRTSIATLLMNMKSCVDTYASRLKVNKKASSKNGATPKNSVPNLEDGDDEGLALLIPDIQETTQLVQNATTGSDTASRDEEDMCLIERPVVYSIEEKYLELMKKLQFDTYEMIVESENGFRFTISHHFETNVRMAGDRGHPARVKRLAQETVTLSTSLPLSYSSSVFVRCDTDRLDIMKVLITGPADTPYANGCFEFDVYFPPDYPNSPMMINLETTGRHSVRFNPNLYNDGKVCLSVLNTWHGRPEEKWNAQTSSFLQVLVSIQSLILVGEPYFNEPGFERSRGTPSATHSSREYNSNIYQATVRWAMLEQLKNPCPCFKEVVHTHFWLKRNEICAQIDGWLSDLCKQQNSDRSGRTISFNSMALRRHYRQLREELAKLPPPPGLEDMNHPFSAAAVTSPSISNTQTGSSSMSVGAGSSSGGIGTTASNSSGQLSTDLDFAVTSPKMDEDYSMSSTLLNELSQHVMFNNTGHTTATNTATSTTINSMDEDGSNDGVHQMNHVDGGGTASSSSSASGSHVSGGGKDAMHSTVMICDATEKEKEILEKMFLLEEGDCSE